MHKFRVLSELRNKHITITTACEILETDESNVKRMATLWQDTDLATLSAMFDELLKPIYDKANQAKLVRDIAEFLGITSRQVNRLIADANMVLPKPVKSQKREEKRMNAELTRRKRLSYTLSVIAGSESAEDAAIATEVTKRHILRMVRDVLKLEGYVPIDLRHMTLTVRKQLANRLEEALKHVREEESKGSERGRESIGA